MGGMNYFDPKRISQSIFCNSTDTLISPKWQDTRLLSTTFVQQELLRYQGHDPDSPVSFNIKSSLFEYFYSSPIHIHRGVSLLPFQAPRPLCCNY